MRDNILLGLWRKLVPVPSLVWHRVVNSNAKKGDARLKFMSAEHHRVRNFSVLEIARVNQPLSAEYIAEKVNLPCNRVVQILDELEKNMMFLFRNEKGEVVWAYPVTAEETPHRVRLKTGEQTFAA